MPNHSVEIPKGTVVKINDKPQVLTKGIKLAQKGNELVVIDLDKITMKNDERMGDVMTNGLPEVTKKFPMPKVKPIKSNIEYDLLKLAQEVASDKTLTDAARKNADDYLQEAFRKLKEDLIEDDKPDT